MLAGGITLQHKCTKIYLLMQTKPVVKMMLHNIIEIPITRVMATPVYKQVYTLSWRSQ